MLTEMVHIIWHLINIPASTFILIYSLEVEVTTPISHREIPHLTTERYKNKQIVLAVNCAEIKDVLEQVWSEDLDQDYTLQF